VEKEKIIEFLKNISFFSSLSEENFKNFSEHFVIKNFPKGEIIVKEGEPADLFYIITSGKVKVIKGEDKVVASLKEGEFFGEMALITDEPRSATVIAETDVETIALSKTDFDKFLEKNPQIAFHLTKVITRRLAETQKIDEEKERKKVNIISVYSPKERIGKTTLIVNLGLILAKNFGKKVVIMDLDLQFGDILFALNIRPERTISDLAQKREIDIELLESSLIKFEENLKVLSPPLKIEEAELVQDSHIKKILEILKENYEYILIDTSSFLNSITVTALDESNFILFLIAPDLLILKNSKNVLEIFKTLAYPPEKIKIGLTSLNIGEVEINQKKIEEITGYKIEFTIPLDTQVAQSYIKGVPLFNLNPKTPLISSITNLINSILEVEKFLEEKKESRGILKGIFGKKK
jgi:pilus assembly protein CpaE